jgi:hypothetical protein
MTFAVRKSEQYGFGPGAQTITYEHPKLEVVDNPGNFVNRDTRLRVWMSNHVRLENTPELQNEQRLFITFDDPTTSAIWPVQLSGSVFIIPPGSVNVTISTFFPTEENVVIEWGEPC